MNGTGLWARLSELNYFKFLPPLFSIYLLFISGLTKNYLKRSIAKFLRDKEGVKEKTSLIQNLALDWAARSGFINAMAAAIISPFSIYSDVRSYGWLTLTAVLFFVIFLPMFIFIFSQEPDEMVAGQVRWAKMSPAKLCKFILFFVNLCLLAAILISQLQSQRK